MVEARVVVLVDECCCLLATIVVVVVGVWPIWTADWEEDFQVNGGEQWLQLAHSARVSGPRRENRQEWARIIMVEMQYCCHSAREANRRLSVGAKVCDSREQNGANKKAKLYPIALDQIVLDWIGSRVGKRE